MVSAFPARHRTYRLWITSKFFSFVSYQTADERNYIGRVFHSPAAEKRFLPISLFEIGGPIMVHLLEKLRCARNRVDCATDSPSDRALTLPALRKPRSSFRPQLEPLEDRLTPSFMQFTPIAHVAVNMQPLPPGIGVEFDPYKNFTFPTAGMGIEQDHITGFLSKQIGMPGVTGACWILQAFYSANATVTETDVLPSPFAPGLISDTFSLTGTETVSLIPVAPTTGPTWLFHGTFTETGTFDAGVSAPDPTTGMSGITGEWQFTNVTLERGIASNSPFNSWQEQIQGSSMGNVVEVAFLAGTPGQPVVTGPINATFWQQDQATECLMQVIPFHPPGPCITVNAAFETWGNVNWMNNALTTAVNSPNLVTGSEQYTDSLMETIMMPDSSMQTVMQTAIDTGTVAIVIQGS
jgi:hypothetical protein